MSAAPQVIVAQGPLVVTETDGGFLPDRIEIGGIDITELIAKLYGLTVPGRGWHFLDNDNIQGAIDLGPVRMTIEKM